MHLRYKLTSLQGNEYIQKLSPDRPRGVGAEMSIPALSNCRSPSVLTLWGLKLWHLTAQHTQPDQSGEFALVGDWGADITREDNPERAV